MNYFISLSAFPCGTTSMALRRAFSVSHTRAGECFSLIYFGLVKCFNVVFVILVIKLAV